MQKTGGSRLEVTGLSAIEERILAIAWRDAIFGEDFTQI